MIVIFLICYTYIKVVFLQIALKLITIHTNTWYTNTLQVLTGLLNLKNIDLILACQIETLPPHSGCLGQNGMYKLYGTT